MELLKYINVKENHVHLVKHKTVKKIQRKVQINEYTVNKFLFFVIISSKLVKFGIFLAKKRTSGVSQITVIR